LANGTGTADADIRDTGTAVVDKSNAKVFREALARIRSRCRGRGDARAVS